MAQWQEQWHRVGRMLIRVNTAYIGSPQGGTEEIKDDIYSFFQNVHHLKDWLRHDRRPA
jgi:hypothetical protein